MIAATFALSMGNSVVNWLILAVGLVIMAAVVKVSIEKECINTGATIIALLILVLFPVSFFRQAGFTAECRNGW